MDEPAQRTTTPPAGRSPSAGRARADDRAGAGAWVQAAAGLLVTAAVGSALVATVLTEATPGPPSVPTSADRVGERAPVDPALLRLWGLRAGADGHLTPSSSDDPTPATPLEELYASLRPAR